MDVNAYLSTFSGKVIDDSLGSLFIMDVDLYGWKYLESTFNNRVDLNTITEPGNYVVEYYINGIKSVDITPLSFYVKVINDILTQIISYDNKYYIREHNGEEYEKDWKLPSEASYIYTGNDEPVGAVEGNIWLRFNLTNSGYELLRHDGEKWVMCMSDPNYMSKSVYDKNNHQMDVDDFINEKIRANNSSYAQEKIVYGFSMPYEPINIAYGNNKFTILAKDLLTGKYKIGFAITLDVDWYFIDAPAGEEWINLTFAYDKFFLTAASGKIVESFAGVQWTEFVGVKNIISMHHVNDYTFFFTKDSRVYITKDFVKYTNYKLNFPTNFVVKDMTFGMGRYYICGYYKDNTAVNRIFYSNNIGASWQTCVLPGSGLWTNIIYGNGHFFVFTDEKSGSTRNSYHSYDGLIWDSKGPDLSGLFTIYSNGQFIDNDYNTKIIRYFSKITDTDAESHYVNISNVEYIKQYPFTKNVNEVLCFAKIGDKDYKVVRLLPTLIQETVNIHIQSNESHVTPIDKENWANKLTLEETETSTTQFISESKTEVEANIQNIGLDNMDASLEELQSRYEDHINAMNYGEDTLYSAGINLPQSPEIDIVYGNGIYLAYIKQSNINVSVPFEYKVSEDLKSWASSLNDYPDDIIDIKFINNKFIGLTDSNKFYTSINGLRWSEPVLLEGSGEIIIDSLVEANDNNYYVIAKDADTSSNILNIYHINIEFDTTTLVAMYESTTKYGKLLYYLNENYEYLCAVIENETNPSNPTNTIFHFLIKDENGLFTEELTASKQALYLNIEWNSFTYNPENGDIAFFKSGLNQFIPTSIPNVEASATVNYSYINPFNSLITNDKRTTTKVVDKNHIFSIGNNENSVPSLKEHIYNENTDNTIIVLQYSKDGVTYFFRHIEFINDKVVVIANGDTGGSPIVLFVRDINVSEEERTNWQVYTIENSISNYILANFDTYENIPIYDELIKVNNKLIINQRAYTITENETEVEKHEKIYFMAPSITDIPIHTTPEQIAKWNHTSDSNHEHNLDSKVKITTDDIVSGIINIDRLPKEAIERVYTIDSIESMYLLTKEDVQNGDVVHIPANPDIEDSKDKWYKVKDDTNLDSELGYYPFTPKEHASIDYSNIKNIPTKINEWGIEDVITKEEAYNLFNDREVINKIRDTITDYDKSLIWTIQDIASQIATQNKIIYEDGKYFIVGNNGYLNISNDKGKTWTRYYVNSNTQLNDIAISNNMHVVVSEGGVLFTATDPTAKWTKRIVTGIIDNFTRIIAVNGRFIAVGLNSSLATSNDGITWSKVTITSPSVINFGCIMYNDGVYIAADKNTYKLYRSLDLTTWTRITKPDGSLDAVLPPYGFVDIVYDDTPNNDRFILISTGGNIVFIPKSSNYATYTTLETTHGNFTAITKFDLRYEYSKYTSKDSRKFLIFNDKNEILGFESINNNFELRDTVQGVLTISCTDVIYNPIGENNDFSDQFILIGNSKIKIIQYNHSTVYDTPIPFPEYSDIFEYGSIIYDESVFIDSILKDKYSKLIPYTNEIKNIAKELRELVLNHHKENGDENIDVYMREEFNRMWNEKVVYKSVLLYERQKDFSSKINNILEKL